MGLKSYVLRFWEGEFEQLKPIRTPSGQRLYSEEHIALISRIKALLHDEGLTIEGARKRLDSPEDAFQEVSQEAASTAETFSQLPLFSHDDSESGQCRELLKEVRDELLDIKDLLG